MPGTETVQCVESLEWLQKTVCGVFWKTEEAIAEFLISLQADVVPDTLPDLSRHWLFRPHSKLRHVLTIVPSSQMENLRLRLFAHFRSYKSHRYKVERTKANCRKRWTIYTGCGRDLE